MKLPIRTFALAAAVTLAGYSSLRADNLLKNADFAANSGGVPADWKPYSNKQKLEIDTQEVTGGAKQSLRVDIVADAGKSLGQIVQKVSVTPNTKYVFKFDLKSSQAGTGVGQIKLLVGSSEIKRLATDKSSTTWKTVELPFDSGEANVVWVVFRYDQEAANVGQKVWFANPSLTPAS